MKLLLYKCVYRYCYCMRQYNIFCFGHTMVDILFQTGISPVHDNC